MKLKFSLIFLALLFFTSYAKAAEINLKSSTQYLWYEDILTQDTEKDITEYLKLNVTKLDKEGKMNIYGYGRVSKQISSGEDIEGKLYYLYLDYKGLFNDRMDLKLGRQFVYISAASGIIDGANVEVKKLGLAGITLFGGRNVQFGSKNEVGGRNDYLWGSAVYLDLPKNSRVELSYAVKYDDHDIARETVGFDFSTTPIKNLNIYGNTKYDVISEATSELLLGVKITPLDKLTLKGEYYESYPTFDTTSIYSVFAVDKYKEKLIKAEYKVNNNYVVSAGYAREDFDEGENANLYEVGLFAKPIKNLTLNINYEKRNGYAGEISGIRLNGEYKIAKAAISAGVDYDDFRRQDSRESTAKKYWAGVQYDVNKNISAVARLENNENYNYSHSYQGLVALNVNF
ncbi:MAG: hypothetical protein OHK0040_11670 [bacterium]